MEEHEHMAPRRQSRGIGTSNERRSGNKLMRSTLVEGGETFRSHFDGDGKIGSELFSRDYAPTELAHYMWPFFAFNLNY